MNLDLSWRIARLHQHVRRAWGSVVLRGWKATLRRAIEQWRAGDGANVQAVRSDVPVNPDGRRHMLVIDTRVPNPARDSGSLRLCMMLQILCQEGWHITLLPDDGKVTSGDVTRLSAYGVDVRHDQVLKWLREHGATLDAVLLCRLAVAAPYLKPSRDLAPKALCIFDTVDLHFLREERAAEVSGSHSMRRQSAASRRRELSLVRDCDISLVVSPVELDLLRKEAPGSRVELVSNIHEIHGRRAPFSERHDLLFIGGFGHPPNEDAVRWFVADILPLLRARDPSIRLHVVGDITPEARKTLSLPGVEIHGRVDDLSGLMDRCKVSIAPLRFGAGVKGKVNMAMSYGLPVVVTPMAAEGMHLSDGDDALIASSATEFAAAIWRVYHDEPLWIRLSDGGLANVRQYFSPEVARRALRNILPADRASR